MNHHEPKTGSRYLYAPFDADTRARVDANERVQEERWRSLAHRLDVIEQGLSRLERRMWLAVYGVVSVMIAQGIKALALFNGL